MAKRTHSEIGAALRAKSARAAELSRLADRANGNGTTRVQQAEAEAALIADVGKRKTARLKEASLQRAGARPKGVGRFFR